MNDVEVIKVFKFERIVFIILKNLNDLTYHYLFLITFVNLYTTYVIRWQIGLVMNSCKKSSVQFFKQFYFAETVYFLSPRRLKQKVIKFALKFFNCEMGRGLSFEGKGAWRQNCSFFREISRFRRLKEIVIAIKYYYTLRNY
jgi:hypothetical protein